MSTDFRFIGIAPSVDLTERRSKLINDQTEVFTLDDIRGYKVYTALLNQSGTNAPVATILENTLVGTVSFYYYGGEGSYVIVSSEGWDETKTTFQLEASNGFDLTGVLVPSYIPIIGGGKTITTYTNVGTAGSQPPLILPKSNNILTNSLIEIRVYN
jgi:hypothetical protein